MGTRLKNKQTDDSAKKQKIRLQKKMCLKHGCYHGAKCQEIFIEFELI